MLHHWPERGNGHGAVLIQERSQAVAVPPVRIDELLDPGPQPPDGEKDSDRQEDQKMRSRHRRGHGVPGRCSRRLRRPVPVDRFAMSLCGDRRWPGDSAEVGCGHVSSHLPGEKEKRMSWYRTISCSS